MRRRGGLSLVALVALACGGGGPSPSPSPAGLAGQVTDAAKDTQLMRDVTPAVNEVIRAQTDCEAAKPALATAIARLDEAQRHVRTEAGRTSLQGMRGQLRPVADLCGVALP